MLSNNVNDQFTDNPGMSLKPSWVAEHVKSSSSYVSVCAVLRQTCCQMHFICIWICYLADNVNTMQ
jgi:hypothetical protein